VWDRSRQLEVGVRATKEKAQVAPQDLAEAIQKLLLAIF
jgi:hypothetical protein